MINLDKLNSQFDINNIDLSQIVKILTEHQKKIMMVFVVGALLMVWNMFNDYRVKAAGIRAEVTQEQGKLEVIKSREAAMQDLSSFKSSIPKELTVFDLITLISNYAKSDSSNIISYTPSPNKNMGIYDVVNVNFTASSDNFKDMMLFLRKIEKSKYPIMINAWSGQEEDDGRITFTIAISLVLIHP